MNDRDHITPIGRPLYKLGLQQTMLAMLQCSASACQLLTVADALIQHTPSGGDGVGLGVGSWTNSSSSSMLAGEVW